MCNKSGVPIFYSGLWKLSKLVFSLQVLFPYFNCFGFNKITQTDSFIQSDLFYYDSLIGGA